MAEWMSRIFLIYLTTILATCLWQPSVVFGNGDIYTASALSMFNINSFNPNSTVGEANGFPTTLALSNASQNAYGGMTTVGSDSGILSGLTTFIDLLKGIVGWIKIFFNIIFSPFLLLTSGAFTGMPLTIVLFFAVPLGAMFIMGIILFFRGVGG